MKLFFKIGTKSSHEILKSKVWNINQSTFNY